MEDKAVCFLVTVFGLVSDGSDGEKRVFACWGHWEAGCISVVGAMSNRDQPSQSSAM